MKVVGEFKETFDVDFIDDMDLYARGVMETIQNLQI